MNLIPTDIIAIVVTALIPMVIGMIWYSPIAFGKRWMELEGLTSEDTEVAKQKGMAKVYISSFISYIFLSYAISVLVQFLVIASILPALKLGFLVWLGFVVPTALSSFLWSAKQKSIELFILNIGYFLVSILISVIVLALWI